MITKRLLCKLLAALLCITTGMSVFRCDAFISFYGVTFLLIRYGCELGWQNTRSNELVVNLSCAGITINFIILFSRLDVLCFIKPNFIMYFSYFIIFLRISPVWHHCVCMLYTASLCSWKLFKSTFVRRV